MCENGREKERIDEEVVAEEQKEHTEEKREQSEVKDELKDLKEEVEKLRAENEELIQKLEEQTVVSVRYLDMLKHTQADFINYKRRVENERKRLIEFANEELIKRLLPVLDDLHRAIESQEHSKDADKLLEGIKMVERKFMDVLFHEGVEPMEVEGELFDPNTCEAIGREETDEYEDGRIIEELRKGYTMRGKVIRPALVKVAVSTKEQESEKGEKNNNS